MASEPSHGPGSTGTDRSGERRRRPPGEAPGAWTAVDAHDIVAGEITYDTATDCYRVRHDFGRDRSIDATVAAAVAAVVDADPAATRPLAEVIDPDALDRLFDPSVDASRDGGDSPTGRVVFRYLGCEVSVDAAGTVSIRPLADHQQ